MLRKILMIVGGGIAYKSCMSRATRVGLQVLALTAFGVSTAVAGTITWHWAGPVTGYGAAGCFPGEDCGL